MPGVSAIVPAAGLSRRFGGPNKLLQPWGQTTVVGAIAQALLGCPVDLLVVTGRDAEEVAKAVAPARALFNPRFEDGLGESIAFGVRRSATADGYLIALGDMPGINADVVHLMVIRLGSASRDSILAPVYGAKPDRLGHPILFGHNYRKQLERLTGDEGARSIVAANIDKVIRIPVPGSLDDIDVP